MTIWNVLKEYPVNKEISTQIISNSMAPFLMKGDIVVVRKKEIDSVQIGDIVCFFHERKKKLIIHRMVWRYNIRGRFFLATMGDANDSIDDYIVSEDVFFGIAVGKTWKRRTIFEIRIIFILFQRTIMRFRLLRSLFNKFFS